MSMASGPSPGFDPATFYHEAIRKVDDILNNFTDINAAKRSIKQLAGDDVFTPQRMQIIYDIIDTLFDVEKSAEIAELRASPQPVEKEKASLAPMTAEELASIQPEYMSGSLVSRPQKAVVSDLFSKAVPPAAPLAVPPESAHTQAAAGAGVAPGPGASMRPAQTERKERAEEEELPAFTREQEAEVIRIVDTCLRRDISDEEAEEILKRGGVISKDHQIGSYIIRWDSNSKQYCITTLFPYPDGRGKTELSDFLTAPDLHSLYFYLLCHRYNSDGWMKNAQPIPR